MKEKQFIIMWFCIMSSVFLIAVAIVIAANGSYHIDFTMNDQALEAIKLAYNCTI